MKILHVVQSLSGGGVSNVVVNLLKAFQRLNVENVVVTPYMSSSCYGLLRESASRVYLLGGDVSPFNSTKYILSSQSQLKGIVRREKPDAVIIQPGWLSLYSCFLRHIPTIIVVHGTYLNEIKYMWNHPIHGLEKVKYTTGILLSQAIETFHLNIATSREDVVVVAVSENTKRELTIMGLSPEKVVSLLNGVDKERFKPMDKNHARALVEEEYGIELRDKVLLHVNPGPRKGTHTLIKAITTLKRALRKDFTLLVVGRLGPETYREHVEQMIKNLGLEENVKMLGYVRDEELPMLYNAADLTVVPSYSEGSPLVIPESLACGTPVVATDVGGNPEYLKSAGLSDLLVNIHGYDFSHALSHKIEIGLQERRRVNRDSIASWSDVAQCFPDIMRQLLEQKTLP